MRKLIKDMKPGERMYTYIDGFDGGYRSQYAFSTIEECKRAAARYVRYGIRLTKSELEKLIKNHENNIGIYPIAIDEDGEEIEGFVEDCVEINESTLDRLY